ncbi:CLUMA_CG016026, isoform A [Clunio marinus]|uniref:CLUMA_CG016026, isoform A n=1 Tax=Clunio marinus TaxID=568069 RepID=A0A1J1IT37_9DIPT|nr:CLUMA_CG016026, isoform A [Clunio marinus]
MTNEGLMLKVLCKKIRPKDVCLRNDYLNKLQVDKKQSKTLFKRYENENFNEKKKSWFDISTCKICDKDIKIKICKIVDVESFAFTQPVDPDDVTKRY